MLNRYFGLSPSGKAKDFDSFTRRFESGQPRHAAGAQAPAVFSEFIFFFTGGSYNTAVRKLCFEMR